MSILFTGFIVMVAFFRMVLAGIFIFEVKFRFFRSVFVVALCRFSMESRVVLIGAQAFFETQWAILRHCLSFWNFAGFCSL